MCGHEDLANFWDVCCCCLSVCVCIAAVGVGAGRQKGWDGLDGGGEITNFAERETELLWKCLGKQVRASFHLLPALCPTLLSPLLWKADQRERRREMFWKSNLILEQSFDMRLHHPDWTSQLDVAFSQFHLLFPRGRELLILWWNREGCDVHSFLEEQSGLTELQSSVLSEGTVGLQSSNQGLCASPLLTSPLSTTMC